MNSVLKRNIIFEKTNFSEKRSHNCLVGCDNCIGLVKVHAISIKIEILTPYLLIKGYKITNIKFQSSEFKRKKMINSIVIEFDVK